MFRSATLTKPREQLQLRLLWAGMHLSVLEGRARSAHLQLLHRLAVWGKRGHGGRRSCRGHARHGRGRRGAQRSESGARVLEIRGPRVAQQVKALPLEPLALADALQQQAQL